MPRPLQFDAVLNPIRVSEAFREELRQAAQGLGVSVSAYMRGVLAEAVARDLRTRVAPKGGSDG